MWGVLLLLMQCHPPLWHTIDWSQFFYPNCFHHSHHVLTRYPSLLGTLQVHRPNTNPSSSSCKKVHVDSRFSHPCWATLQSQKESQLVTYILYSQKLTLVNASSHNFFLFTPLPHLTLVVIESCTLHIRNGFMPHIMGYKFITYLCQWG